jgi:ornithine carbamoyltransferase
MSARRRTLRRPAAKAARGSAAAGGSRHNGKASVTRPRARAARAVRHYLSVTDLSAAATEALLRSALRLKRAHALGRAGHPLAGKTLAMVFQKPSLRTRVSFEAGMTQLGSHAIYLGPDDIRLGQRESVEDIARVLSRMSDLIMARVFGHEIVAELARHATVPVINGLSDREHPCQILGDLLTLIERRGRVSGLRAVFVGDGNNVANSLLLAAGMLGMHLTVAGPEGYEPPREIVEQAAALGRSSGGSIRVSPDLENAARGADVLYTDVWTSMGQEAETELRRRVFAPYQINPRLLSLAAPEVVVLHCLPAHYGEEIDYAAARGPRSAIFDQAENRLHAQKALMVALAG